ncbi:unnamed protein product [Vitrella brassicaformis CCMP3155]|uniref:Zinc finger PHD-type domain-containing protein n=1 Tax=Vitrella brassicaformis (strain CCMP3155) TaxID=1169540 RepID=A0A0G4EER0_VITBC|nr:unnamed protein product [Vitrella brassicaformis CCMP3155]|eukprot:CEL94171.1 unnamed protein product [Vitrella brassicaformis CCMP3155]
MAVAAAASSAAVSVKEEQPETVRCTNTQCPNTALTRDEVRTGWPDERGVPVPLCDKCADLYQRDQYCPHCMQVYESFDEGALNNPWVGCDFCSRWVHRECERNALDKRRAISNPSMHHNAFLLVYKCPACRQKQHHYQLSRRVTPAMHLLPTQGPADQQLPSPSPLPALLKRLRVPACLRRELLRDHDLQQSRQTPPFPALVTAAEILQKFEMHALMGESKGGGATAATNTNSAASKAAEETKNYWKQPVEPSPLDAQNSVSAAPNLTTGASSAPFPVAQSLAQAADRTAPTATATGEGTEQAAVTVAEDFVSALTWYFNTYFFTHLCTASEVPFVTAKMAEVQTRVADKLANSASKSRAFSKEVLPIDVAGGVHLLRLCVCVPRFLAQSPKPQPPSPSPLTPRKRKLDGDESSLEPVDEDLMALIDKVSMFLSWFDKRRSELLDRHYQSLEEVDKMTGVAGGSGRGGGVKEEGIKQEGHTD